MHSNVTSKVGLTLAGPPCVLYHITGAGARVREAFKSGGLETPRGWGITEEGDVPPPIIFFKLLSGKWRILVHSGCYFADCRNVILQCFLCLILVFPLLTGECVWGGDRANCHFVSVCALKGKQLELSTPVSTYTQWQALCIINPIKHLKLKMLVQNV